MTPTARGRLAYVAYGMQRNFRTYDDQRMPVWSELPTEIQAAWIASAGAVWDAATIGRSTGQALDAGRPSV